MSNGFGKQTIHNDPNGKPAIRSIDVPEYVTETRPT